MRKLFALYFLINLLFYQIVLNIINAERWTSPIVKLVIKLYLDGDSVRVERKFISKIFTGIALELIDIVGWIIKRDVFILENNCLIKTESRVWNCVHDFNLF